MKKKKPNITDTLLDEHERKRRDDALAKQALQTYRHDVLASAVEATLQQLGLTGKELADKVSVSR